MLQEGAQHTARSLGTSGHHGAALGARLEGQMAPCSNGVSLVVSQQLRVCDARDDDRLRRP